jgi:hypothetical protein
MASLPYWPSAMWFAMMSVLIAPGTLEQVEAERLDLGQRAVQC